MAVGPLSVGLWLVGPLLAGLWLAGRLLGGLWLAGRLWAGLWLLSSSAQTPRAAKAAWADRGAPSLGSDESWGMSK